MFKKKFSQSIICLIMASIYILGTSGWGPTLASKISLPFSSFLCAGHGCGCDRAGYELEACRCFTNDDLPNKVNKTSSNSCCSIPEPPPKESSCCTLPEPASNDGCCSSSPEEPSLDISTQLTLPSCGSPSLDGTDFLATHIIFSVLPKVTLSFSKTLKFLRFSNSYTSPLLISNDKIPIVSYTKA